LANKEHFRKMDGRRWLLIGGGLALLVALFVTQFEVSLPSRPTGSVEELRAIRDRDDVNVVFVLIDTLRADRLSAYGYERPTSPTLDEVASSGVLFEKVEAQSSWTKASMASLWTGLFPHRTGVVRFQHGLPDKAAVAAEVFQQGGFLTAGLFRNGWVDPNFGFGQGFDLYLNPTPRRDPQGFRRPPPGVRRLPGTDQDLTYAAIEFLKRNGSERFMLYVHYMDVHQYSYDQEAAALRFGPSISDSYDAAIHWTDRNFYALIEAMDDLDLLEKTIVVVASDHGEAFREHGREGHAQDIYVETTHTPLIFMLPFRLSEPLVVEPVVRNVDIWPTLLDLVGLPPLPETDGVSLVPLMEAAGRGEVIETPKSIAYVDQTWGLIEKDPNPVISLRGDGKRLLFRPQIPEAMEVYDVVSDPGEKRNLLTAKPEWLDDFRAEIEGRLEQPIPWGEVEDVEVDDMKRGQLRALGYVIPPGPAVEAKPDEEQE
jgi:arylsulfatase A-like enzyme